MRLVLTFVMVIVAFENVTTFPGKHKPSRNRPHKHRACNKTTTVDPYLQTTDSDATTSKLSSGSSTTDYSFETSTVDIISSTATSGNSDMSSSNGIFESTTAVHETSTDSAHSSTDISSTTVDPEEKSTSILISTIRNCKTRRPRKTTASEGNTSRIIINIHCRHLFNFK